MVKYKIKHERDKCIGCGACVAGCSKFWEMGDDSKSNLKGATNNELVIDEKDLTCNQTAADNCPVKIIHIEKV